MIILRFFKDLFGSSDDPVKHCELHRAEGCAHVDGFLCNLHTCEMRKEYNNRQQSTDGGQSNG